MEEKFTFLTLVSDPECELICQRLREAKIKYQIKNPPEGAPWSLYRAALLPPTGKEIWVLAPDLKRAKELLGLKDKKRFSRGGKKFPLAIRIILFIGLVAIIVFIILQYVLWSIQIFSSS